MDEGGDVHSAAKEHQISGFLKNESYFAQNI
jgi:hypothetical protein